MLVAEAFVWRCSGKNVFLKISQNSQENTCARVSFLTSCRPQSTIVIEGFATFFFFKKTHKTIKQQNTQKKTKTQAKVTKCE